MTAGRETDDPMVIEVTAVGIDEYDDIVAWLVTGSAMMETADVELGREKSPIAQGMRIAAARIHLLEAEIAQLKEDAARDRPRH
jgi:hypothetical protein